MRSALLNTKLNGKRLSIAHPGLIGTLVAILVATCLYSFTKFPVYPDEIAFRILSGRWIKEGLHASGIHWICNPSGIKLEYFFMPAAISLQTINSFLEDTNLQRQFAVSVISIAIAVTFTSIARLKGIHILSFLPIAATLTGLTPIVILIQRPEQLWVLSGLAMLTSISLQTSKGRVSLLCLSFLFFYLGTFVHVEFILLVPALIICGWQTLNHIGKKFIWVILVIATSMIGRQQYSNGSNCSTFPEYQAFLNELSAPKLSSLSTKWNDFSNNMTIGGNYSPQNIMPPLPDNAISLEIQKVGIGLIWLFISISLFIGVAKIFKSLVSQSNPYKNLSQFSQILMDPSLTGLLILGGSIALVALDPTHTFYRSSAAVVVGSFAASQSTDITHKNIKFWNYLKAIALSIMLGGLFFSITMWSTINKQFEMGYAGPSVSQRDWKSANRRPLSKTIHDFIASNPSEAVVIDDTTYNIAKDNYKKLIPVTYLSLAMDAGADLRLQRILQGQPLTAIVLCHGNEKILAKLEIGKELKYYDEALKKDICMGGIKSTIE